MEGMERTRGIFIETVQEEYSNYCKARGEQETINGFSQYLVNKNVIEDKTINRFLAVTLYPTVLNESEGVKTLALYALEDIVCLSYRSLRNVVVNYAKHFKLKKRVVVKTCH